MKYISITKLGLLFLAGLLFFLNVDLLAQDKGKKKKKSVDWAVKVGLETTYDNNILKYSEKYLDRFMNREDEGRFHIETYDDIIVKPSLSLSGTYKLFKKKNTKVSLYGNYNAYMVNPVKDWSMYIFGVQQYFAKKASFRISYTYIPEFYVRHFRDEDRVDYFKEIYGSGYIPEAFVPFSFSKDNYGIWVQNTFFKDTRIRLNFDYALYYHNKHYTEYDAENFYYGFNIYQGIGKKLDVNFGYQYMTSDAIGYDEPFETGETSDDADADHEGDSFWGGVSWRMPNIKKYRQYLGADFKYIKKYYTTDAYIEIDPEHAGRVDNMFELAFEYRLRINKSLNISAYYKRYGRDSLTSSDINSEYVSDEKDFKQYRVGMKLSYGFNF